MAVEVRTTRNQAGTHVVDKHPDGSGVRVADGHLHVMQVNDALAIYAPGAWSSSKVVTESQ